MLKKTLLSLAVAGTIAGALALAPTPASAHAGFGFRAPGFSLTFGSHGHGFRHWRGFRGRCAGGFVRTWVPGIGVVLLPNRRCGFHRHW